MASASPARDEIEAPVAERTLSVDGHEYTANVAVTTDAETSNIRITGEIARTDTEDQVVVDAVVGAAGRIRETDESGRLDIPAYNPIAQAVRDAIAAIGDQPYTEDELAGAILGFAEWRLNRK